MPRGDLIAERMELSNAKAGKRRSRFRGVSEFLCARRSVWLVHGGGRRLATNVWPHWSTS